MVDKKNVVLEGSHVNFSCNPLYQLKGKNSVFCNNGTWENEVPNCVADRTLCYIKPPKMINTAHLIGLSSIEIKNEIDYGKFNKIISFTKAQYTCNKFELSDAYKIKYKNINNKNVAYIEILCN